MLQFLCSLVSRRTVVSYWRKYVHEVLVNRLGGLSLPRKSVVRLTDRPDMTLDVYRGRKTTMQCNFAVLPLELRESIILTHTWSKINAAVPEIVNCELTDQRTDGQTENQTPISQFAYASATKNAT